MTKKTFKDLERRISILEKKLDNKNKGYPGLMSDEEMDKLFKLVRGRNKT